MPRSSRRRVVIDLSHRPLHLRGSVFAARPSGHPAKRLKRFLTTDETGAFLLLKFDGATVLHFHPSSISSFDLGSMGLFFCILFFFSSKSGEEWTARHGISGFPRLSVRETDVKRCNLILRGTFSEETIDRFSMS